MMTHPSIKTVLALCLTASLFSGCQSFNASLPATVSSTNTDIITLPVETVDHIGLTTQAVQTRENEAELHALGEIKADENRLFHISSLGNGRILKDNVMLGDTIKQGQTLAVVENLDVVRVQAEAIHQLHDTTIGIAKAKARYALAQKNLEREKRLVDEGISPRKDLLQAEAEATIAKAELTGSEEHQTHIKSEANALLNAYGMRFNDRTERINSGSPIIAPRNGVVIKKSITLGDVVDPSTTLYEVADLNQVWLDITVYPNDIPFVKQGQLIRFTSDSMPKKPFTGRINYLQPVSNMSTATFIARAYLDNSQGLLKPGMFGQVVIVEEGRESLVFIPESALHTYGKECFVFVAQSKGQYRRQVVKVGHRLDKGVFILSGLSEGEKVVTRGSFSLKGEWLKNQLKADDDS